ncbi:hypothetical protein [Phormidium sp. CCY1219]|uniref:hypothetical protein n=1 Tax=Phormidium sp. CCY1219 TaxID=2886104 RepID=UPI002D1E8F6F|nr:hypothetical protein [Phormidium sp. CCY1219]MEB3829457.1 hypothetical protein [Phormidium sp. CCY1219]
MLKTTLIAATVILGSLYIGFGDQIEFLPENMQTASYNTRTGLTNFAQGLVPGWVSNTKEKPDMFERTNEQLEQEEQDAE